MAGERGIPQRRHARLAVARPPVPLGRLGDEELALVQAFADQAAVAIQNARLYRSLGQQAARMQSIQDLSARLNRLTDVRAIAAAMKGGLPVLGVGSQIGEV
jgi:GAF domain-containing protein